MADSLDHSKDLWCAFLIDGPVHFGYPKCSKRSLLPLRLFYPAFDLRNSQFFYRCHNFFYFGLTVKNLVQVYSPELSYCIWIPKLNKGVDGGFHHTVRIG